MIYASTQIRPLLRERAYQNVLQDARLASSRLDNLVGQVRPLLITLAHDPAVHQLDSANCDATLTAYLDIYKPNLVTLGVADPQGKVVCSAPIPAAGVDISLTGDTFYPRLMASQDFTVGEFKIPPVGNQPVIGFGYPIIDADGDPQGIIFSAVNVDTLNTLVTNSDLPTEAELFLLDRNNTVVARSPNPTNSIGEPNPLEDAPLNGQEKEGTFISPDEKGIQRLYGYSILGDASSGELKVVLGIPTTTAFAGLDGLLNTILGASFAISLLAVAVIWWLGNRLVIRQVNQVLQITQRITAGDLSASEETVRYKGDSTLTGMFERLIQNVKEREIQHRQEEEAIRHQVTRVEALANTANRLNAQHDLPAVLQCACEIVSQALRLSACGIRLYNETQEQYHLVSSYGLPTQLISGAPPLARRVFDLHADTAEPPGWLRDPRQEPHLPKDLAELPDGWQVACIQMAVEGRTIGLLNLYTRDAQEAATLQDSLLVKGLADEVGLAIANAQSFDALKKEQERRAKLFRRSIFIQEDERLRIARELHDETVQSLAAINVYLETSTLFIEEQQYSKAILHIKSIKMMVNRILEEIRRLIADLRPSILDDMGLIAAISWYADLRFKPAGINYTLNQSEPGIRLPTEIETALFRIGQETITNIVRHSQASQVSILIDKRNQDVIFEIIDDGIGFEPDAGENNGPAGFGLIGITERVENLGGEIQIDTARGNGTQIVIRIPILQEENFA